MTQNANEAKKSQSFAEQLVFASSIHSSMIHSWKVEKICSLITFGGFFLVFIYNDDKCK